MIKRKIKSLSNEKNGYAIIYLLVIIFIFSTMLLPIIKLASYKIQIIRTSIEREQALQIAEAGIKYYEWRLNNFSEDYTDGTGLPGPYEHDYLNEETQEKIGKYRLKINPPLPGETTVEIKSTGWTSLRPDIVRTVTVKYGLPSLAQYALISDKPIWIGENENINGRLHSNAGIRFDGTGNSIISSGLASYLCTPEMNQGCDTDTTKDGIWGEANETVKKLWHFPSEEIDLASFSDELPSLKILAEENGIYLPPSEAEGYSLVFKNDGTVDIYKVLLTLPDSPTFGLDTEGNQHTEGTDYEDSDLGRTLVSTNDLPGNALIYVEDKVWVEGKVSGRATIITASPDGNNEPATIYIPNDLTYSNKDGTDVLGLISEKDIVITNHAPDELEINAVMLAPNGSTEIFYYPDQIKDSLTIYGSIISAQAWTWSWAEEKNGPVISGFENTEIIYDRHLLTNPPPYFRIKDTRRKELDWQSN